MDARQLIERFGGQSALADLIGKGQSTVAHWAKTGVIPAKWQPKLLLLSMQHGIGLTASDLVGAPSPRSDEAVAWPPYTAATTALIASTAPFDSTPTLGPGSIQFQGDGAGVEFRFDSGNQVIWATANNIADLFQTDITSTRKHLQNILSDEELDERATSANFALVQIEGSRSVRRDVTHYNLDMILSVGYRINAKRATAFRQWATQTLRAYLDQGYVINEKALRESPAKLNQLAAQIRSLRSEEKQVYAKVRECFKISSSDFDSESSIVRSFYALLQDKFHHAVTGSTAAKLIMDRAHHTSVNMGLHTLKGNSPTLADATAGKNYLTPDELYRLHMLSEQFLLYAESTSLAGKKMTMESLHRQLDRLLTLNDYPVFEGYKDYIKDQAMQHARIEYGQYKKRLKIEALGLQYDEDAFASGEYDGLLMEN